MISSTKKSFRTRLLELPPEVRRLAFKSYQLWLRDPHHPSVRFKKVGRYWSARVGSEHRALARVTGETAEWFWIGPHDEYERLIRG